MGDEPRTPVTIIEKPSDALARPGFDWVQHAV
jgi:hypothetical protein